MDNEKLIFCLEGVPDIETFTTTAVVKNLEQLAFEQGITSIYKTCGCIEGLEESLGNLLYEDHNFKNYEIIGGNYYIYQCNNYNTYINYFGLHVRIQAGFFRFQQSGFSGGC